MDVGQGRGRYRLPAFLRHKHIPVQKQERKLHSDPTALPGTLVGINSDLQVVTWKRFKERITAIT